MSTNTKTAATAPATTQQGWNERLDARGLNCPLPILQTKKKLQEMVSGRVLQILATDPGSVKDFEAFCKQTGNKLLSSGKEDGAFIFYIQKA